MEALTQNFSKLQTDLQELLISRQQLETQFQENKLVKEEFDKLEDDAKIYKLVGPVLLPQDSDEANLNVDKRIEFIKNEIERVEKQIAKTQNDLEKARDDLVAARTQAVK